MALDTAEPNTRRRFLGKKFVQLSRQTMAMHDPVVPADARGQLETQPPLLTIGYGTRAVTDMLAVLAHHGIKFLIDVRSTPWSRYRPEFSQDQFAPSLQAHGISYLFMGDELGGRPDDPACYDDDGRVDYRACESRPAFREGVARLQGAWRAGHSLALMCSEGRPEDCHRTKLVAAALVEVGVVVRHIDEGGTLRSHDEVLDRLRGLQTTLLEDPDLLAKSRGRYRAASA